MVYFLAIVWNRWESTGYITGYIAGNSALSNIGEAQNVKVIIFAICIWGVDERISLCASLMRSREDN